MTDNEKLGINLKKKRKEKMLTLQELSDRSEISAGYISKIERGTVNPSVKRIQRLCFALEISMEELMGEEEKEEVQEEIVTEVKAGSIVIKKQDRTPVYGIENTLDFSLIYDEKSKYNVSVMTLEKGMTGHYYSLHSYDEFGIVAKGKLGIHLNETDYYELEEGECIKLAANTKHAVTNCSDEECISYWIRVN